jgi:hypothetical protein
MFDERREDEGAAVVCSVCSEFGCDGSPQRSGEVVLTSRKQVLDHQMTRPDGMAKANQKQADESRAYTEAEGGGSGG